MGTRREGAENGEPMMKDTRAERGARQQALRLPCNNLVYMCLSYALVGCSSVGGWNCASTDAKRATTFGRSFATTTLDLGRR